MLIREQDRLALLQIFEETDCMVEVWAYGSRVNGQAHAGSDLDLVARTKTLEPLEIAVLEALKNKIQESNIPILVELRDWSRLPESFHQQIQKNYEVLFRSKQF